LKNNTLSVVSKRTICC